MKLPHFDARAVRAALPFGRAMKAIEDGLRTEIDPEDASPRLFSPAPGGQFLLMPTQGSKYSGVKVLSLAPRNPTLGLANVQGLFQLFDSSTLTPLCTMDAAELTAIRTPATTLTAVRHLAANGGSETTVEDPKVLIFGTSVQARNHIEATRHVFPHASFAFVGRDKDKRTAFLESHRQQGFLISDASEHVNDRLQEADIILCCTSSSTPLFDGSLPRPGAIVAAIGQHGREAREVDETLVMRSDVVVEGRAASWEENGNLLQAREVSEWKAMKPPNLRELVREGIKRRPQACALYTGAGMAWEDLLSAAVVYEEGNPSCR